MSNSNLVHVGHATQFEDDSRKLIKHGARNIAVIYHKKKFYAMDNACYHHGGPLLAGDIEDLGGHPCIICPWHSYRITLDTGEGLYVGVELGPAGSKPKQAVKSKGPKQRVHRVVVEEDGNVYVAVDLDGPTWESDRYAEMAIANQEDATGALVSGGSAPRIHSGLGGVELRSGHVFQSLGRGRAGMNPLQAPSEDGPSPIGSPKSKSSRKSTDLYVTCSSITDVCKDVKAFHFVKESGILSRMGEMGEYVELELPVRDANGVQLRRKWTVCERDVKNTLFTLIVKANNANPTGGSMWLHRYGLYSSVRLCRAAGTFTFVDHMPRIRALQGQVLWLTAGIAITSAYANIHSCFSDSYFMQSSEHMHVAHIHVDRHREGVAKLDSLRDLEFQLAATSSSRRNKTYSLHLFLTKEAPPAPSAAGAGRLMGEGATTYGRRPLFPDIKALVDEQFGGSQFLAYVCGPPAFVEASTNALLAVGLPDADILTDDP